MTLRDSLKMGDTPMSKACVNEALEQLNAYRLEQGAKPVLIAPDGIPAQRTDQAALKLIEYLIGIKDDFREVIKNRESEIISLKSDLRKYEKTTQEMADLQTWVEEAQQALFIAAENFRDIAEKSTEDKKYHALYIMMQNMSQKRRFISSAVQALRPYSDDHYRNDVPF